MGLTEVNGQYPRLDAIPFTSENQYMATLHGGDERTVVLKGAPEVVFKRCLQAGDAVLHQQIAAEMNRMGANGMRVLALAAKQWEAGGDELPPEAVEDGFGFLGLIGMIDPPREEAIEAIKACHRAGIVVKMITGDHRTTALAIGTDLNLVENGQAVTGVELATMAEEDLQRYGPDHQHLCPGGSGAQVASGQSPAAGQPYRGHDR